eukprot:SAG11_NODE_7940_length_1079_cov_1.104082_1_plen_46_part_00
MEVPRMLLAIAGKFPGTDYIDQRVTTEDLSIPEGSEGYYGRIVLL